MKTIRVAIIGCGSIAEFRHAPEYAANEQVEIAAFFDHNPERAERLVDVYGGRAAPSIASILADPDIDAVSVCTSNETHEEVTVDALQAGKHVLCEKPIATSVEGARAMMKAGRESGRILMVGHNQRFSEAHVVARRLIESGEIGKVLTFQTTFGHSGPEHWAFVKSTDSWFFSKERSVLGAAGDLGIHKLDLIRYLLEDEIADIAAFGGALHKTDADGEPIAVNDNMVCIVKTEGGVLGTVALSWTYYGEEDNSTVLYGEKGILKIFANETFPVQVKRSDGTSREYEIEGIQTNDNQTDSGVINAFVDCIVEGKKPPVSARDGLVSLKLIEAMMKAADERRSVRL
ncbi:Gfo/Idh/MocA family protein [Paenibacillus sacheonensis]|uniref:Gfo/Idh/MocA family oxidoreductase n=1 Tax=Paenibacillus sacheonensis TaxID=742054 RepID=A0A7X5C4J7_9BACL|nr:Gfo/Idh/MocA family oxidoreductase [Paenibacillus sacheonensis]MBM7568655.1 putative dehydrogenase [Paenibacillus sacheonensis]NBC72454.1 Gfo/Idh/MocA family oxidoreductase [Paenibacillus sacheonensis]